MSNLGFRVLPLKTRPDKALIERLSGVATPLISDNMNRLHGTSSTLRPIHKKAKLLGTAFTVKTRAGDNLLVHKAIDLAEPGDVIVVDAGGDTTQAIIGEIMMRLSKKKGIKGFVIDGTIRDSAAFKEADYPCFAKGVTHRGPYKEGPGEINVPVTVGNMIVHPGDIIVGDEDGLLSIPLDYAEEIIDRAITQLKNEKEIFKTIEAGTINRDWIDETLTKKGCTLL
ncbi:RraA family protein [Pullulanibacillus pueri]|uniref:Putative 4-hydroxy-4-methyl-2-oxoglutarate aldolase n=1 Tax=Pullulanibacillus pueri TaxID=1437324 RepID=A0A8J2ZWB6_9BACL|nr:RraA family protein [Pullulanibacillus pueri]MBM7682586.1 RraA family protein [Pullulanibacillus pueri]GGH82405.1 methyltransferase [Pullulanibacillus pueri]